MFQCEKRPEQDKEKNNMPSTAFFQFHVQCLLLQALSFRLIIKYQNSESELWFGKYDSDITRGFIMSTL